MIAECLLRQRKVLNRLLELRDLLSILLSKKNRDLAAHLADVNWIATLAYFADVFEHLNTLNASMQGPQTNLISLTDKLSGFVTKLDMWRRRISAAAGRPTAETSRNSNHFFSCLKQGRLIRIIYFP